MPTNSAGASPRLVPIDEPILKPLMIPLAMDGDDAASVEWLDRASAFNRVPIALLAVTRAESASIDDAAIIEEIISRDARPNFRFTALKRAQLKTRCNPWKRA